MHIEHLEVRKQRRFVFDFCSLKKRETNVVYALRNIDTYQNLNGVTLFLKSTKLISMKKISVYVVPKLKFFNLLTTTEFFEKLTTNFQLKSLIFSSNLI